MANPQHKSMDARVERWQAFYRRDNETPLFGFFVGTEYPVPRYPAAAALPTDRPLEPGDFDPAAYADNAQRLFEAHESCGGDFIFSACAYWGIPWLEALLGCPLHASHESGSISAEPPASFVGVPQFDPCNPWVELAGDMLESLATQSNGRFPLATTRMRGVADLLAAVYGNDAMPMKLMMEPEEAVTTAAALTNLFIAFAGFQLERIPAFHGGIGSFYYYAWAPPGTVWHQEDAAALLSPPLYEGTIQPCDARIVDELESVFMHTHSTGYIPLDPYLDMGFLAFEHHIDAGGPPAEALFERHCAIQARYPLLIWGDIPEADLDWIFEHLDPRGLAVLAVVEDRDEAAALWKRYAR